jgi:spermidine synthase
MKFYIDTAVTSIRLTALLFFILSIASLAVGVFSLGTLMGLLSILLVLIDIRRWNRPLEKWLAACAGEIEPLANKASPRAIRTGIAVTAALTLFLELVLIRWEASIFPVFAIYKNLTLLSCFCGLGVGYALSRRERLMLAGSLPMLAVLLLTLSVLRYGLEPNAMHLLHVIPVQEETTVFFNMGRVFPDFGALLQLFISLPVYILLAVTFLMNALALLPAGQFCGYLMQRARPLESYGWNLLGSIAGAVLLFGLSWAWTGPVIWFGLATAALAHYLTASPSARTVALWSVAACVLVVGWPVRPLINAIYSPYQIIEQATTDNGLMRILAAGSYFQNVTDYGQGETGLKAGTVASEVFGYYELPFRAAHALGRVAIVGAGSGNDVAAALRNGAASVDAVEIDPAIRDLGFVNHPEHPYSDPRAHSVIDDARSFFRSTRSEYDAIVYSVLDSHVAVSHGGNMRVDSFVYTREGLQDAFAHLKPGGLMSVSFTLPNHLMGEKIFRILRDMPGASRPAAVLPGYKNTTMFLVGKGADIRLPLKFMAAHKMTDVTRDYLRPSDAVLDLPTDDWPFFYMDKKMYPATYVAALALVKALAFFFTRGFLPAQRPSPALMSFFFLGGGFMLVETKAITELSLLFGNTWHVVGITIIGVLIMAWLANCLVGGKKRPPLALAFAGLLLTIAAGYCVARFAGIGVPGLAGKIGMVVLLTGPLFFSGIVFSTLFAAAEDIGSAMAYNLMGAMLGGVLEYNAMQFGFSALYLIALALYAAAWLTSGRKAAKRVRPPS